MCTGGPAIIKIKITGAPSMYFRFQAFSAGHLVEFQNGGFSPDLWCTSYIYLNNSWSTSAHMIAGAPVLIPN